MNANQQDLEQGPRHDLRIAGMHCAACSQSVEYALRAIPGVQEASVNLLGENASVTHDGSVSLDRLACSLALMA